MKKIRLILFALIFLTIAGHSIAQEETYPDPPIFKPYLDKPGKVVKYNNFNYLDIRDEEGVNTRQAMGNYWEVSYAYDSVFRQKRKFRNFVVEQISQNKGNVFFEDTSAVHFVVPAESGNIWGRLVLASDKIYRLRLIRETGFHNTLDLDGKPSVRFDKYVDSIELPPRINFMPDSWITRASYSKFNHQTITWNMKDTLFKQKIMGPYWDFRLEVRNSSGRVDKTISTVEILESYYRSCVHSGGKIIKSRPRELIFTMPAQEATIWCRVTASLEGVYLVRATLQADKDQTAPEVLYQVPVSLPDTSGQKEN